MIRQTIIFIVLAVVHASCEHPQSPTAPSVGPQPPATTVAPQPPPIVLTGTVVDTAGNPLEGAVIGAWSGPEAYGTTDARGEFTITCCNLSAFVGTDVFSAAKAGYSAQQRTLESGLNFVLAPVASTASRDRSFR